VRVPARAAGLPLVLALTGLAAVACSDPPREIAVRFVHAPGSTVPDPAQVRAARASCPGGPGVRQKPAPTSTLPSVLTVPLRYDVTGATDAEVARVEACLAAMPGVDSFYQQRRTDG